MPRRKQPTEEIERADWFFENCPLDLLQECLDYETAREIPEIREAYKVAQKAMGHAASGIIHIQFPPCFSDGGELTELKTIRLPDGFPKVPFLKTQYAALHELRTKEQPALTAWRDNQEMSYRDRQEAVSRAKLDAVKAELRNKRKAVTLAALDGVFLYHGEPIDPTEFAIVKVDLRKAQTRLKTGYSKLLPVLRANNHPPTAKEHGPLIKTTRASLNALGALRLSRKFKTRAAIDYSAREGARDYVGLFSDPSDWRDAVRRAKGAIEEMRKAFKVKQKTPSKKRPKPKPVKAQSVKPLLDVNGRDVLASWEEKQKELRAEGHVLKRGHWRPPKGKS